MEQEFTQEQHLIDDLAVWRHKIRGVKHAVLPTNTFRPNPLVHGGLVISSVFHPGMIYAVNKDNGNPVWRLKMDGYGGASVTYASGIIYGKTAHTLYAIDAKTGKLRWTFCPYGKDRECIYSSPTIAEGLLFIGDRAGLFHCLDAKSGKQLWWKKTSRAKNRNVNATAAYHNGLIIIATNAGIALAYDPLTGRQVWKQRLDSPSIDELCIFEGQVLVQTTRSIYSLSTRSGEINYRLNWRGERIRTFTIADDMLIIVSQRNSNNYEQGLVMRCLRKSKVIYEQPATFGINCISWGDKKGLLYESSIDGLKIINAKSGKTLHSIKSKKNMLRPGRVDIQGDIIYLLSMNGTLYAIKHP